MRKRERKVFFDYRVVNFSKNKKKQKHCFSIKALLGNEILFSFHCYTIHSIEYVRVLTIWTTIRPVRKKIEKTTATIFFPNLISEISRVFDIFQSR